MPERSDYPRRDESPRDRRPGRFSNRPQQARRPASADAEFQEFSDPQKAVGGIKNVEDLLTQKPGLVHRILFQKDSGDPRLYNLQKKAKHLHIHYQQLDTKVLAEHVAQHQGVVALCNELEVSRWENVRLDLFTSIETQVPRTVAVLTNIEDPRNLGACLRSSLALGAQVVLMPAKGMCGLTPAVTRSAAGALSHLILCRPDNLESALTELVSAGYRLIGLDAHTETSLHQAEFGNHSVIAVGGEDRGLPPFIRKQCHQVARIPMAEQAHSFNASVAMSLGLYECARQRQFAGLVLTAALPDWREARKSDQ